MGNISQTGRIEYFVITNRGYKMPTPIKITEVNVLNYTNYEDDRTAKTAYTGIHIPNVNSLKNCKPEKRQITALLQKRREVIRGLSQQFLSSETVK